MLSKEKLSKIVENAIGALHYTYTVAKVSSQNSFAVRLYDQHNEELVVNSYIYEGDEPGLFAFDSIPERSNKTDREVLRLMSISSRRQTTMTKSRPCKHMLHWLIAQKSESQKC